MCHLPNADHLPTTLAPAAERRVRTRRSAASIPQRSGGVSRGNRRIQGGPRGKSQSPWPSLAAGGCHMPALTGNSGARKLPQHQQSSGIMQSTARPLAPATERCARTPRSAASNPYKWRWSLAPRKPSPTIPPCSAMPNPIAHINRARPVPSPVGRDLSIISCCHPCAPASSCGWRRRARACACGRTWALSRPARRR